MLSCLHGDREGRLTATKPGRWGFELYPRRRHCCSCAAEACSLRLGIDKQADWSRRRMGRMAETRSHPWRLDIGLLYWHGSMGYLYIMLEWGRISRRYYSLRLERRTTSAMLDGPCGYEVFRHVFHFNILSKAGEGIGRRNSKREKGR